MQIYGWKSTGNRPGKRKQNFGFVFQSSPWIPSGNVSNCTSGTQMGSTRSGVLQSQAALQGGSNTVGFMKSLMIPRSKSSARPQLAPSACWDIEDQEVAALQTPPAGGPTPRDSAYRSFKASSCQIICVNMFSNDVRGEGVSPGMRGARLVVEMQAKKKKRGFYLQGQKRAVWQMLPDVPHDLPALQRTPLQAL